MKLLNSRLYVYRLDPVIRHDRARQYELQVDVGQLADDSGPLQIKTFVLPFQRLSSKQSPRDLLSAELNSHALLAILTQLFSGLSLDAIASTNGPTSETDSTSTLLAQNGSLLQHNTIQ
jgi:hypothetical protein